MKVIIAYFGTMWLGPTLVELVWQLIERYKKNQAWWWWQTGLDFLNAIKVRLNSDAWNEFFQVLYSSTITFLSLWCKLIGANFFWAKNHASKSSHYFTAFVSLFSLLMVVLSAMSVLPGKAVLSSTAVLTCKAADLLVRLFWISNFFITLFFINK